MLFSYGPNGLPSAVEFDLLSSMGRGALSFGAVDGGETADPSASLGMTKGSVVFFV